MCALIRTVVELVIFTFCLIVSSSVSQARTSSSPGSEYGSALRNISVYPPCATDGDCATDHKCMQYMCYPWKTSTGFRWCSKDDDCESLMRREGGDGNNGLCFRHPDRDNIHFGICLQKIETKRCYSHGDCPRHLRCVNGYCGDRNYYEALKKRQCEDDSICEQLLTGEMCCYDLSAAEQWSHGHMRWIKKCCNNPSGHPVMRPSKHLSHHQMKKLDKGIAQLAPMFLDTVICEGLEYSMMTELESCQLYTTTTTTTDRNQRHTSGTVISVKINFFALFIMLICIKILQHMSS